MRDNFTYKSPILFGKSPYSMWVNTYGDCRDFSCFGRYVAQQHGYTAYEMYMRIYIPGEGQGSHVMGIYREGSSYSYSDVSRYGGSGFGSFQAIINDFCEGAGVTYSSYAVYDNCKNVIAHKGITADTKFMNPGGREEFATFIGAEAKNRSKERGGISMTLVNKENPALHDGAIRMVGIYSPQGLKNVKIATFYRRYTNTLATRDYVSIGNIGSGEQIFEIAIEVRKGDWIGMSFTSGTIDTDTSGFDGIWAKGEDNIPCTYERFTWCDGDVISLGGFIVTPW
jgi:hypothetical protein